jgi:hypothetical protein
MAPHVAPRVGGIAMLDTTAACQKRLDRFVHRVCESKSVWGLKNDEGWAVAPSNDEKGTAVMLFWSDRAYAAQCAKDEWAAYVPTAIPLVKFLAVWLPGMANDGLLVGTNWNAHLIGLEVMPVQLLKELQAG